MKKLLKGILAALLVVVFFSFGQKAEAYTQVEMIPKDQLYVNPIRGGDKVITGYIGGNKAGKYDNLLYRNSRYGSWSGAIGGHGTIGNGRFSFAPQASGGVGSQGGYWEIMAGFIENGYYYWTYVGVATTGPGSPIIPEIPSSIEANDFEINTDTEVLGTWQGNVRKVRLQVNGNFVTDYVMTNAFNTYKITQVSAIREITDDVWVYGYDYNNNYKAKTKVKLHKNQVHPTITPAPYSLSLNTGILEGTFTGDLREFLFLSNGVEVSGLTVAISGNTFAISDVRPHMLSIGSTEIKVIGRGPGGDVSVPVIVVRSLVKPDKFVVGQDTWAKGTVEGGISHVSLTVNGQQFAKQAVNNNNTWEIYSADKIKAGSDRVTVQAYSTAGKKITESAMNVSASTSVTTPGATGSNILSNDFKLGATALTGSFGSNLDRVSVNVNGRIVGNAQLNSNGTFSFNNASAYINNTSDRVILIGFDRSQQLIRHNVKVVNGAW